MIRTAIAAALALAVPSAGWAQSATDRMARAQSARDAGWQFLDMQKGCVPLPDLDAELRTPDDMLRFVRLAAPGSRFVAPDRGGSPDMVMIEAPARPEPRYFFLLRSGPLCRAALDKMRE